MKTAFLILCTFLFYTSNAQQIDSVTIEKSQQATSDKPERLLGYFSGIYLFTTHIIDEKGNVEKTYTREVKTFITDITSKTTTFLLLCIKYGFEDPEITSLIRRTAYIFDVVEATIDRNGKIISIKDENREKIKNNWEKAKQKISETFAGDAVRNYFYTVDYTVNNDKALFEFLETDKMYGMLFNGVALQENQTKMPKRQIKTKGNETIIKLVPTSEIENEEFTYKNGFITKGQKTIIVETDKKDENGIVIEGQKMKKKHQFEIKFIDNISKK